MSKRTVANTAGDPIVRFSTLTVDGQEYKLAYDFNAIAQAETITRCNLLSGMHSLGDLSAAQLRGLLYAALSLAQPKMTADDAGKLVRFDTLSAIENALVEAYKLSTPEKKENPTEAASDPAAA